MLYLGTELQFAGSNVGIHWCALVLTGVCMKYGVFWEKNAFLNEKHTFFSPEKHHFGGVKFRKLRILKDSECLRR